MLAATYGQPCSAAVVLLLAVRWASSLSCPRVLPAQWWQMHSRCLPACPIGEPAAVRRTQVSTLGPGGPPPPPPPKGWWWWGCGGGGGGVVVRGGGGNTVICCCRNARFTQQIGRASAEHPTILMNTTSPALPHMYWPSTCARGTISMQCTTCLHLVFVAAVLQYFSLQ